MGKILVLGIGSRLMMDDGIGIYLAEELGKLDLGPGIEYQVGESDIDYCLDAIENFSFAIILDAVCSGKPCGEISVWPLKELQSGCELGISPHNAHLFNSLGNADGYLIGVEPFALNFGIGLSEIIKGKWPGILEETSNLIKRLTRTRYILPDCK